MTKMLITEPYNQFQERKTMKRAIMPMILATVMFALFAAGCGLITGPDCCCTMCKGPDTPKPGDTGVVCLWVSSDKDAFASYGRVGEEVDRNFGQYGFLSVANGPLGIKHSYVHFTPPTFPAGTEILEAKFEMYHSGKNEDGTTDDILLNVGVIRNEPWSPGTLTWANRPDRDGLPAPETEIRLRSQNWSGTPDITGFVQEMGTNPNAFHGFLVWYRDPSERQVEKGFYSNNDSRRTQTELGLAPRLVIRVRLPQGKPTSDMKLGYLPGDTDITVPREVTTVKIRKSQTWPADWNVSK
jgi:hypothetical protein